MTEYLKILDMTEGEQQVWWGEMYWEKEEVLGSIRECSIPTAAFRLRDKVVVNHGDLAWHKATLKICGYMGKSSVWFKTYAKPIHWIVAALIAGDDK